MSSSHATRGNRRRWGAVDEPALGLGDVVCYGDHVAFYAGDGRILHATGRKGVRRVVEERAPAELTTRVRARRRVSRAPLLV